MRLHFRAAFDCYQAHINRTDFFQLLKVYQDDASDEDFHVSAECDGTARLIPTTRVKTGTPNSRSVR